MALVDAYDTKTGKKLPYLVPEEHIDHPVLGKRLSRLPSDQSQTESRSRRSGRRTPKPVEPVTQTPDVTTGSEDTIQTPDAGDN